MSYLDVNDGKHIYCEIDEREEGDILIETDILNLVDIICQEHDIINNKEFENIITKAVKILYFIRYDRNHRKIMNDVSVLLDLKNTKDIFKLKQKYMRLQQYIIKINYI